MRKTATADELLRQQLGRAVRLRRSQLGLTQVTLGERINRDQATVSKIEHGDYKAITLGMLIDLAYGLDCSPGDLLDWPLPDHRLEVTP